MLNSLKDNIAVINQQGEILCVNNSWITFGQSNGVDKSFTWEKVNYLTVCDNSAAIGDEFGIMAASGIRQVIAEELEEFYIEYPCHSPFEQRWFSMRVSPIKDENLSLLVITHQNITQRKIAEESTLALARIDGLTNVYNRRYFDDFLHSEWQRCKGLQLSMSLIMVDLDHFKLLNDEYGHMVGDECLRQVGKVLSKLTRRTSDMCARYGGEEFAIILGGSTTEYALDMAGKVMHEIAKLAFPHKASPVKSVVTASVGVATLLPHKHTEPLELLKAADTELYLAKSQGRDQVSYYAA